MASRGAPCRNNREYTGIHGNTGYTGIPGNTREYGIHGNTREYPGIHGNTQQPGNTREYPGIHWNTREYTGIHGNTVLVTFGQRKYDFWPKELCPFGQKSYFLLAESSLVHRVFPGKAGFLFGQKPAPFLARSEPALAKRSRLWPKATRKLQRYSSRAFGPTGLIILRYGPTGLIIL